MINIIYTLDNMSHYLNDVAKYYQGKRVYQENMAYECLYDIMVID